MPLLSPIIRRRRLARRPSPAMQLALSASAMLTLLASAALFLAALIYAQIAAGLPSLQSIPVLLEEPNGLLRQPTRFYDRTNQHLLYTLRHPAAAGSQYLRLNNSAQPLPAWLVQATLAARQPDYWQSPGYSLQSLSPEEHATLAQQLVFELLLADEPAGLRRALRERLLASQLIQMYGHEWVLEWYINSSQYGPLIYGLDAAARAYFGKPAAEVSLAEAALLAALNETPEINPAALPDSLWTRQEEILAQMFRQGWIDAEALRQAGSSRPLLQPATAPEDLAPAFNALVLQQAAEQVPLRQLQRGGYRIVTTLDFDLQNQAACSAAIQLERLKNNAELSSESLQKCPTARLLPTLDLPAADEQQILQVSAIILENTTGQILALVGSGSPTSDPALVAVRPGGGILAPLVYLTAFSRGFSPGSLIWDIPGSSADQLPFQNYYGPLRLRTALANAYPGPLNQLLTQLSLQNVLATAEQLGLSGGNAPTLDPSQGAYAYFNQIPVSLPEISQALATLGNQGLAAGQIMAGSAGNTHTLNPSALLRLEDPTGRIQLDWSQPQTQPVVSAQLAFLINHVLSDEIARWPSLGHPNSLEVGRPAAALQAGAPAEQDGWSAGYTPYVTVGVWFGTLDGSRYPALPQAASALWHALLQTASQPDPLSGWNLPAGVSQLTICDPSGLLPSKNCPKLVSEVFLNGAEPTAADNLYRTFQLNRETGRLATVFTPSNLVEEKVFLVTPPQAQLWAQQAGIEIPPSTYDTIFALAGSSEHAVLQSPELFSHVSGKIKLYGVAAGPDFSYYRLQAGQGLNPRLWFQIGEDIRRPVIDGVLAEWDTSGLSGLYAVQLLVINQDQVVSQSLTQVTIDNEPPQVSILSPQPAEAIQATGDRALVLQAQASDNLEIARLEFYLDGKLLGTLSQFPYYLAWTPKRGEHHLRVQAFDLAGNSAGAEIKFQVAP